MRVGLPSAMVWVVPPSVKVEVAPNETADSAAHLEVEQKVTGRRGDMASQSQPPRQPPVEELATVHVQGRGDDKPQFVDQALFEQRLGQCDAPVHADITAGPLPQLGDELDQAAIDDRGIGPGSPAASRSPRISRRR
jgi:hypothetical protein